MKNLSLTLVAFVLLFTSCDSLFDNGDNEKVYNGPDVVGFFPLEQTISASTTSGTSVEVQLIGEQKTSDVSVSYAVHSSTTATSGTHYTVSGTSVTIPANSSTADINVGLSPGDLTPGQEVKLVLELQGGSGLQASENLKLATIFIRP
ncbi:MAG: Calx-beta domain-containing protein [Balneolaceae bacterium]|nr:Calx-beta domain-containing protein [Balneolaceae bacterium]MDR9447166.1 Calx-beta domain-containing protein [Balneolaceae bacterium]